MLIGANRVKDTTELSLSEYSLRNGGAEQLKVTRGTTEGDASLNIGQEDN